MLTLDALIQKLHGILAKPVAMKVEEDFLVLRTGGKERKLPLEPLRKAIEAANAKWEGSVLSTPVRYEAAVRPADSRRSPWLLRQLLDVKDKELGVTYRFGDASDEYWLHWVMAQDRMQIGGMASYRLSRLLDEESEAETLQTLRRIIGQPSTITLTHGAAWERYQIEQLRDAWLFHLAYNLDLVLLVDFTQHQVEPQPMGGRRARPRDIESPKRTYDSELIYYYQTALATPGLQFRYLSFYHVLEHFFERIHMADLVETVRRQLTTPEFSMRRDRDLYAVVRKISRIISTREDGIAFKEDIALRLTLEKIVNPDALREGIEKLGSEALVHYRTKAVEFCGGDPVNLEDPDLKVVLDGVTNRIYKTRNAIVHSKEGERGKFRPFKHDAVLAKEIPLIRLMAELVIIGKSVLVEPPQEDELPQ
jgi:hypothetical protein